MSYPNVNTLWAETLVAELVASGVDAVCISPGSRSTPLTVAFAQHPDVTVFSHLDERSSAFFALGRARRTGQPTPLVCTSGTAAANFHPAVIESTQAGVPMLVLTADRPPELIDSGANQTVDQEKLYGDAVRWYRDMPEPEAEPRKIRMLRTTAARALSAATGADPGPVHLNCRFRKPLEPIPAEDDDPAAVPEDWADGDVAAAGREGPFVRTGEGVSTLEAGEQQRLVEATGAADRGLVVAGPAHDGLSAEALVALAEATGFPVLADPLSDLRFGPHVDRTAAPVCGGYDAYLGADPAHGWPDPDVVLRFGASPTSKPLRHYLRDADCRQFVVDPSGDWTEAEFTATDLLVADEDVTARAVAEAIDGAGPVNGWTERFAAAEKTHWAAVEDALSDRYWEGGVLADVAASAPDPATVFVSNSMPVRDIDRFGEPRTADLTVLGNRGASGIDGITSTALGAGSATTDPLVLVTGDLAYYHDMNGLLALGRCGVDATIVLVNNDGGGIFHMLPIADHETFESQFRTPHGLDFAPTSDLYDLSFERVHDRAAFVAAFEESVESTGTQVVEVPFDAAASHEVRDDLERTVADRLG
jgi:2-succinyl-5-enolpyruvyl-6-hydroxy-3-cyclohexene-1-carboxylate synthase